MIPVIDLFAGPGGLNEGFCSLVKENSDERIFKTLMSIEKDPVACKTLRFRAFFRAIMSERKAAPSSYLEYLATPSDQNLEQLLAQFPDEWRQAENEALCAELKEGDLSLVETGRKRLAEAGVAPGGSWVLIGGPPCQAYSLVGRSRRAHDETLATDVKQTLYKCYLDFIRELKPAAFVMENVKGMLSAQHAGEGIFNRIRKDMQAAGYSIHSLVTENPDTPNDYVVRAEQYGVPQARHRVILLGIREDIGSSPRALTRRGSRPVSVGEALAGIPRIRSGFSRRDSNGQEPDWRTHIREAAERLLTTEEGANLRDIIEDTLHSYPPQKMSRGAILNEKNCYQQWYRGNMGSSKVLANHEARRHQAEDIDRYFFCAVYAKKYGAPAHVYDFPDYLIPKHRNVRTAKEDHKNGITVKFSDRFRVQIENRCSTTITSHIAKDGHYYIHPDPNQARSLTVREAARLQTFPDDYFFAGNRTSQYQQVGNAVPPMLAQQIAQIVAEVLGISSSCYFDQSDVANSGIAQPLPTPPAGSPLLELVGAPDALEALHSSDKE